MGFGDPGCDTDDNQHIDEHIGPGHTRCRVCKREVIDHRKRWTKGLDTAPRNQPIFIRRTAEPFLDVPEIFYWYEAANDDETDGWCCSMGCCLDWQLEDVEWIIAEIPK